MQLQIGQKLKFLDAGLKNKLTVKCLIKSNLTIDIACFGLDENNKLSDDAYMVFYNQRNSPNHEISLAQTPPATSFDIDLDKLPSKISKLMFTATVDGSQNMSQIQDLEVNIEHISFKLAGKDFVQEKAIMMVEIYKKDNLWRLGAVGQGFNGGLEALLNYFGGQAIQSTPSVKAPKTIFLEKRLSLEKDLEKKSPKLLNLSKKAAISLEKKGLGDHRAKVALCLDISMSMKDLYKSGAIQAFAERILALGCRLDDDGSIDIFLFGECGYQPEPLTVKDFGNYIPKMLNSYPLEPDTKYAQAIELVRKHYTNYKYERSEPFKMDIPVYCMFLTDGQNSDKAQCTRALKNSSYEPIFWQFMGIEGLNSWGRPDFSYLEKLDDLPDRYIDNADFFKVSDISKISDDDLYTKLTNEYPSWVKQAKVQGLLD